MRVAFNALSVGNLSGRHVLLGHIRQVLEASGEKQRHLLLHHRENRDLAEALGGRIDTIECPALTADWALRASWERLMLPRILRKKGAQLLFSPAGVITPGAGVPQLSLAQNPWCLVPTARKGFADEFKAALQRAAYRRAQRGAALMMFNSNYMQAAYRKNAGFDPVESIILHQGVDDATFDAARSVRSFDDRRCEVVVVSVMARHKAVEDVVTALNQVRRWGVEARLKLVGAWPDAEYKRFVVTGIQALGLTDSVDLIGHVSRDELYRRYGEARVFCLLSRCESFGIPAIEAEAFGTPAVLANCGAAPEIAGPGGVVITPGRIEEAASVLCRLLTDSSAWAELSERARNNAERFRWGRCSRPLTQFLFANK